MRRRLTDLTRATPRPELSNSRSRRNRVVGASLAMLGLLAASCGSDAKSSATTSSPAQASTTVAAATTSSGGSSAATTPASGGSSTGGTGGSTAPAGTGGSTAPAATSGAGGGDHTGQVIKVGYVNNEGGVFSLPEFRTGGEVAIDEINAHGGVNGAKIQVVECLSDASPEGAINCANKLVEAHVAMAYTGIDVASDAAIGIYSGAGIPFVTSNGWGPAQEKDPNAFILHAASGAYFVTPLSTMKNLGVKSVGVVREDTVAGQAFSASVKGYAAKFGLAVTEIVIDPANPNWTAALATAQSAGVGGIWGQLTEPGCIGMTTAAAAVSFKGVVFAGSCSTYISKVGAAAVGTYNQTDEYFPDMRQFAPAKIQGRLDEYSAAMKAAGHEDQINGFAVAPYSAWYELLPILQSTSGDFTPASVKAALTRGVTTPGWLGPDLNCGAKPWPDSPSACSGSIAVWKVVKLSDGTLGRQAVADFANPYKLIQ